MIPCTEEIEPLGDEELERKQAKAEAYASEPGRFTLFSLELEMKSTHGNRLITYDDGKWSCSCDFFLKYETCSHVMATGRILKLLPIVQPRGNMEDT